MRHPVGRRGRHTRRRRVAHGRAVPADTDRRRRPVGGRPGGCVRARSGSAALRYQPPRGGEAAALDQQPAARPGAAGGAMMFLSSASIRRKLAAMLMMTSSVVLVLASIAYVAWDYYRFRNDMITDLATQAELVLDNTAVALAFNDHEAANETLQMLSINSHVRLACLYSRDGRFFSEVRFDNTAAEGPCPASVTPGSTFTPDRLQLVVQLTQGRNPGAMVYLSEDLDALDARLRTQGAAVAVILLAGLALSFLLSYLLERAVGRPIVALAGTARDIAEIGRAHV